MHAQLSPSFATTIDYRRDPLFEALGLYVARPISGSFRDAVIIFLRVLLVARREKVLLLSSSWGRLHPEVLAAAFIGLWPSRFRPRIILLGCMWEPNNGLRSLLEKLLLRLADRAIVRYVVQSTEELSLFPLVWGVAHEKMRFCPFFFTFDGQDSTASEPDGEYVFAGGNSMRDYEPLVEAARRMPERKFIFATHHLDGRTNLPPNIVTGTVPHERFMALLRSAWAVVVPIEQGLHRAAGQQTYLNAMWLGKPTIVNDTLGVRDHIEDGQTGLVVNGTAESYVEALNWIANPDNLEAVKAMSSAGRQAVEERFSFERHIEGVLSILNEVIAEKE
jgi:glycosyltransferase involved in cell wall biosynthesis